MSEGCTDLRNCVVSSGEAGDPAAGENAVTIRWSWSKLMRDKSIPSAHAHELDQDKRSAELQLDEERAEQAKRLQALCKISPRVSVEVEVLARTRSWLGRAARGSSVPSCINFVKVSRESTSWIWE